MVQAAHQTQAADASQIPDVNDVWLEFLDRIQQHLHIVRVNQIGGGLPHPPRDLLAAQDAVGVIAVDQPKRSLHMIDGRAWNAGRCRQHAHFMIAAQQPVDDLSATQLIAADIVGRIKVA